MSPPIPHAAVAVTLLLLSCACHASAAAPGAVQVRPAPKSLYERVRAFYPEQIPPFVRAGFRKYDDRGENVSVGYNRFFLLTTTTCAFTAYFYPLPPAPAGRDALADHLARARREVLDAHPGAKVVSAGQVTAEKKGKRYDGLRVTFRYEADFGAPGKRQAVLSDLYLFRDGDRAVKYRITFAADDEKTEQEHLEKFLAAFPWPD